MVGIREVVESTLRVLELVEVRGKNNRAAMTVAVENLEAIVSALREANHQGIEVNAGDGHDEQGPDV